MISLARSRCQLMTNQTAKNLAFGLGGTLLDQRLAVAGHVTQVADRLGRDEAAPQQTDLEQLRDPLAVFHVGLSQKAQGVSR